MKVAKLVEYNIVTRVIVNDTDSINEIIRVANNKLLNDPSGYICGDNVVLTEEDSECPYNPEFD